MKMLLVLYTGDNLRFVPDLLSSCEGCSWTEFQGGIGKGSHHRHEGTRTFPGETMMVLSILEDARAIEISDLLRSRGAGLPESDRLHVAVLPVEQFA